MVAVETPDEEVPAGTLVLGRYQIVGKLAQGGMAEVYLARQVGPGGYQKLVVCKRVRPHLAKDDDFVGMFVNEARLAAMINHPNVVQIFDLGEEQMVPDHSDWYLAMEYLDGRDMLQVGRACRAHNKAVPFDVTARIIADACAGLEYAHHLKGADGRALDLVHRDMSPENLIITFEGQVKVVDFGIAKARDNSIRTQAGQIKGKLGYVAPEAIMGKPVDARADVFAVGATLYLFLSGRPAFSGATPMEIFERSLKPPARPMEVNSRVPPVLDEICMKALAQDRDQRFQSAGEVRAALDAYLASTGRPLGAPQLSQFMRILFPPDKDPVRQRIDALLADAAKYPAATPRARISAATAGNAPRTVSVPQQPIAPLGTDVDRTAVVSAHRAGSNAPRAVELSSTKPMKLGGGPSHLRSVGVSDDIPDLSNPRAQLPRQADVEEDDGKTLLTGRLSTATHPRGINTQEEPRELHTVDIQAMSELQSDIRPPTPADSEESLLHAMAALAEHSQDGDAAGSMTMETAPASSDPDAAVTAMSPVQRSLAARGPETGDAQGTELPPPFEPSSSGLSAPQFGDEVTLRPGSRPDALAGAFAPPEASVQYVDEPVASVREGPSLVLKLTMALLGALTAIALLLIGLGAAGHLKTVLGL